jgi:MFS transporter, Spinster family, sphingosine-1-phosphate transporter
MIRRPTAILALLTALNFVNYLDRYELAAVLARIQADVGISNFQGGLLFTVFLVSFLATCPLFGFLGDRVDRKYLLAIGAFGWSFATIATGLSTTVTSLFIARACVGIGEASFTTLAPTLIDDIAPSDRKGRWLSIFSIAAPVGSALGYIVGGLIAKLAGWHMAFFVGGTPGLMLGALVLMIAEPARGTRLKLDVVANVSTLLKIRPYVRAVAGYAALTFAVGGFGAWGPAFLQMRYHVDLAIPFGAVTVVAGLMATLLGGAAGDRAQLRAETRVRELGQPGRSPGDVQDPSYRERPPAPYSNAEHAEVARKTDAQVERARVTALLRLCSLGSLCAAPFAFLCFLAPSPITFFACAFVSQLGIFWSNAPINATLLRAVPNAIRGAAMALCITAIHLFGDLWSPPLLGRLADAFGTERMYLAMLPLSIALALSALIWWPFRSSSDTSR